MEEELKPEMQQEVNTQTISSETKKEEPALDNLPRLEDLLKSEKEIQPTKKLEGVTEVEKTTFFEQNPFAKKEDKKAPLLKKRVKIVTGVFVSVITLLLAFVGVSTFTLASLHKQINSNTETIQSQQEVLTNLENTVKPGEPVIPFEITLNEPRDYSDDKKELTILDKLTIMFRSLFG